MAKEVDTLSLLCNSRESYDYGNLVLCRHRKEHTVVRIRHRAIGLKLTSKKQYPVKNYKKFCLHSTLYWLLPCFGLFFFLFACLDSFASYKVRLAFYNILLFLLNYYFRNNMIIDVCFLLVYAPLTWKLGLLSHNLCFQRVLKHLVSWGETSQMAFVFMIAESQD